MGRRGTSPEATPSRSGSLSRFDAAGDAIALAYLVVVLVVTVLFDGGLDDGGLVILGVTALVAAPVIYLEAARCRWWSRALLLVWGLGIVLSVVFAVHRADMTEAVLTYGLPPVAYLAALRLRRRPWGAGALVAVIAVSAVSYWGRALLVWLEPPIEHMRSNWLAVGWHNPTGALMGAFAVLGLAFALHPGGRWRIAAGVGSAAAFAGLWLTGSRGAVIATVLGGVVALIASRQVHTRVLAVRSLVVVLGATLATVFLLQVGGIRDAGTGGAGLAAPADEPVGLVRIGASAGGNLRARFAHMDAGLRLFERHPVTGAGMGAYGDLGNKLASPGANLTLSAHNEFVEAAAEGGIIFGIAFLGGGLTIGFLVWRRTRRGRAPGEPLVGWSAAASGVATILLVHTAVDIDWRYPVIPALLAVSAAMLTAPPPTRTRGRLRGLVVLPLVVALLVGTGAAGIEASVRMERASTDSDLPLPAAPWDLHRRSEAARQLAAGGDVESARHVLAPAARWNPRSPTIDVMSAVLDHRAGDTDATRLIWMLDGQRTGAGTYVLVAEALLDSGGTDAAGDVIDEGMALTSEHAGTPHARADLWELRVRYLVDTSGCTAARREIDVAADDPRLLAYVTDIDERLRGVIADRCPRG